ncbi:MAG: hypothetical protein JWN48_574, partial [Myxococcaceae bacterium]|nr:hypothetical protein [Myxococcaceae bacterium]
ITYSPTRGRNGRALYVATDGGLSRRAHGSDTWTGLNDGLTNSLINDLDIGRGSEANRAYSYAGFQDQGTQVMKPGFALPRWQKIDGGDNAFVAVDPSDPRHALTSAGFKRTTDGSTITSRAAALKGNPVLLRFDPNVVADVDHKRLYMSAQGHGSGLYATNDSAATVTLMHDFGAMIVAIAVVRGSSDVMYVATEDNLIWRTSNATEGMAAAWSATTRGPLAPAGGSPVALAIDPRNPNVAVAVYSAFSGVSPPAASRHVWLTTDGNLSWADISGSNAELALNVPDMPLADVVFDSTVEPSAIIVAGEFGVLRSGNHGATWDILARGLPAVQASSLAIDDSRAPALLRVGTYGRSAFELRTDAQVDVALRSEDGRCLEAPDPSNGSAVRMASCTASANQKWTLAPTGELKTLGNKCLDVRGPSSANGTYVQVWDCGDLANQKWHMMTNGNLVGFDNKCLDVDTDTPDGAKVQIWRCLGTREVGIPNQTWSVPPG